MTDINLTTHTFKICDTVTGQKKVIHRKMLMLASFLPVDPRCEASDSASAFSLSANASSIPEADSFGGDVEMLHESYNKTLQDKCWL